MLHYMKLNASPYERIVAGTKTIEIRLYDEKRQAVNVGDQIEFAKLPDLREKIRVNVLALHKYKTFRDLASDLGLKDHAANPTDTIDEWVRNCYTVYSPEEEQKYGVVGIRIKLV